MQTSDGGQDQVAIETHQINAAGLSHLTQADIAHTHQGKTSHLPEILRNLDHPSRNVIGSHQIDKSTFSLCLLNRIERLGIESK